MPKERILITVKTYPTLSRKYGETVCTAGLREDGSWVRIYPVPFRRLTEEEQYAKYDWVECKLIKSEIDPRPETRKPADVAELTPTGRMNTADNWRDRRKLVLKTAKVATQLQSLIDDAKSNRASLAVFKPTKILDFTIEEEEREWDRAKLAEMREKSKQVELFADERWRETFKIIPKLPYSFSYKFEDVDGKRSTLQILDWETGALFWNCVRQCDGDETAALKKVKAKYMDNFLRTDLHFYLGTTQQYHLVAPNPWVIVGVLPIPFETQQQLF